MVICADGGLRHTAPLGVKPDAVVGDLDSAPADLIQTAIRQGAEVHRYPPEKDQTDTELALDLAVKSGAAEVIMLGCLGERLDHSLGNLFLLPRLVNLGLRAFLVNENNQVVITKDRVAVSGCPGHYLSLIPLTPEVSGIKTTGLKYPLNGETLKWGEARGISNQFLFGAAEISVGEGWLMVIVARD